MPNQYSWKSYFVVLSDYQQWANDRLFAALGGIDRAALQSPQGLFFDTIHHTVDHLMLVNRLWLARLRGESLEVDFRQLTYPDWDQLIEATQRQAEELTLWLESCPEIWFDGQLDYLSSNGEVRSMWMRDALTHMMNHQTHHRGQISAVITRLGATAPEMDYVYYKRDMESYMEAIRDGQFLDKSITKPSRLV